MREKWKVFLVSVFHFRYKETKESVSHKAVTHLLQRELEWKAFVIRDFHICYTERGVWKAFVAREFHIFYKKRSMEGACDNRVSYLL